MKRFRTVVFWMHLAAGVTAGVIVLIMSITGALLALKPQILDTVYANVRLVTPPRGGPRLGVQALVASVRTARPDARPTTVTLQADRTASASVALERDGTIYVDPYSGRVLGEGSRRAQLFFRTVEDWHRSLGVSGEQRAAARAMGQQPAVPSRRESASGQRWWWSGDPAARGGRPGGAAARQSRPGVGACRRAGADVAVDHRAPAGSRRRARHVHDCRRSFVESVRALAVDGQRRDGNRIEMGPVRRHEPWAEMAWLGALRSYRRAGRRARSDHRGSRVPRRHRARVDRPLARVPPHARVAAPRVPCGRGDKMTGPL